MFRGRQIEALLTMWKHLQAVGEAPLFFLRSLLTPRAQQVFDHPHVQRLHKISHLGVLYKVCPTIGYCNRLVHSVSVALLARATGLVLAEARDQHLQNRDGNAGARGLAPLGEDDLLCLEVAGLLHDVGHGPFSHFYDQFAHIHGLDHVPSHEERGIAIADVVLAEAWLHTRAQEVEVSLVKHFIHPDVRQTYSKVAVAYLAQKSLLGLGDIVANKVHGFDVDRLDYLGRDAFLSNYKEKAVMVWTVVPKIIEASRLDADGLSWVFPPWAEIHITELSALRAWMFDHIYLKEAGLKRQRRGVRRSLIETHARMYPTTVAASSPPSGTASPLTRQGATAVRQFDIHAFLSLTEEDFDAYLGEYNF